MMDVPVHDEYFLALVRQASCGDCHIVEEAEALGQLVVSMVSGWPHKGIGLGKGTFKHSIYGSHRRINSKFRGNESMHVLVVVSSDIELVGFAIQMVAA